MKQLGPKGGFTLIELAIVIMISSLLLVSFLDAFAVLQQKQHIELTKARMETLRAHLIHYVTVNERLPCPASPATLHGAASTGDLCAPDSIKAPDGIIVVNTGGNVMAGDQRQQVWVGLVPVKDLRLGGDEGKDGWGNPFTYAVSRSLTLPRGMIGNPLPVGHISVVDGNGNNLLDKPDTGRFVIISHGPSDDGGWTSQGVRTACKPDTLAAENCKDTGKFVDAPFSRASGRSFYDQFLLHDGLDAGGDLLARVATCDMRRAFYVPADPSADENGCVIDRTLWHGACLQSTVFPNGLPQPLPAETLLAPAVASGTDCTCAAGYKDLKINTWSVINGRMMAQVDAAGIAITADKMTGKITGTVSVPNALTKVSELHTCIQ